MSPEAFFQDKFSGFFSLWAIKIGLKLLGDLSWAL
jgi:hypothetical protein